MATGTSMSSKNGRQSSDSRVIEEERSQQSHHPLQVVSGVNEADASSYYKVKVEDEKSSPLNSRSSSITAPPKKIIHWDDGDPENPYNWSTGKKVWIVIIGSVVVVNSTMGSSLPSNAIPFIANYFDIDSRVAQGLPISMFLVGYVVGPLVWGPLSEALGRKIILLVTFLLFTIFTMACAVAPNWAALLVFRFWVGVFAGSPIALIGGIYADIYDNPVARGRAMAVFIGGTCSGPLAAPLISGFITPAAGWRWTFWFGLIFAGASWVPLAFLPETYGPVLLSRRAAKLRKETGDTNIFAAFELEKKGFKQMATVTLTRPLRMIFSELIVMSTCMYMSLAYGIFYMFFQAYPLIFQGIYHQSPGVCGLMFLPIVVGVAGATAFFLYYDWMLCKAQQRHAPWTQKEESRRLPLACVGGPLYVIALFWIGWTARESVPFWVPMLAGIPFGMGFILIFMALLNYLADAYEIFAASAMAASSCCRSLAGAVLPFATPKMYDQLGIAWATSLLAFLSLGMCAVPFVFLWKGDRIRAGSKFCTYLREKKEEEARERERERGQAIGKVV